MVRRLVVTLALSALSPGLTAAQQDSALVAALARNRHTIWLGPSGRIEGSGGALLVRAGRAARFF